LVKFYDGSDYLGEELLSDGEATIRPDPGVLSPGSHMIIASYIALGPFLNSTGSLTQIVNSCPDR
jgi:hypothetical protein